MNTNLLKENKVHGTPVLPLATYIETISPKKYEISLHWHSEIELVYIADGQANFTINLENYSVKKGDYLIVPPNALHSFTPRLNHDCTCNTLIVDLRFIEGIMLDSVTTDYIQPIINGDVSFVHHFDSTHENYQAIHHCHTKIFALQEEKNLHYTLKLKASLFELLVLLFDAQAISNRKSNHTEKDRIEALRKVMTYIYTHRTSQLSISELASVAGYSDDYFIRFFKKHLHQTPINYIKNYRLDYSRALLEVGKLNITEIAFESGFNSVSYYIKLFKKHYGMTPKDYKTNSGKY